MFNVPDVEYVKLEIYDLRGRLIDVILDENFQSGANSIKLDISDLTLGTYVIKIETEKIVLSKSFVKN